MRGKDYQELKKILKTYQTNRLSPCHIREIGRYLKKDSNFLTVSCLLPCLKYFLKPFCTPPVEAVLSLGNVPETKCTDRDIHCSTWLTEN